MRVFMTGATGFVGLNIVTALLAAEHDVVCHLRPGARRKYLERLPVTLVEGDVCDTQALRPLMQGAECVIHTAGNTSCNWRDIDALRAANVDSTRSLLEAARHCGVRRLVYTSSTATIGSSPAAPGADEQTALRGWRAGSPYARTKLAAEALLMAARDIETIILNPAEVVGAWDHSLQWGRIVLAVAADQLPFVPPGAGTFSPADAVAQAHVAALTRGLCGQRYILGGEHWSFARFIEEAGQACGRPVRPRDTTPYALQRLQARLREAFQPLGLGAPAVDAYRMRVFGGAHLFDDTRARRELGYAPGPVRNAVAAAYHWYQEHGFLPPGQGTTTQPTSSLQESATA